jgi:hypothetical protein
LDVGYGIRSELKTHFRNIAAIGGKATNRGKFPHQPATYWNQLHRASRAESSYHRDSPAGRIAVLTKCTKNVCCASEGCVRIVILQDLAVVRIQLIDFRDLRWLWSPVFRGAHACVAIRRNQRVTRVFALLPQKMRYAWYGQYDTPKLISSR